MNLVDHCYFGPHQVSTHHCEKKVSWKMLIRRTFSSLQGVFRVHPTLKVCQGFKGLHQGSLIFWNNSSEHQLDMPSAVIHYYVTHFWNPHKRCLALHYSMWPLLCKIKWQWYLKWKNSKLKMAKSLAEIWALVGLLRGTKMCSCKGKVQLVGIPSQYHHAWVMTKVRANM